MAALMNTIEDMKPAYVHAMKLMNTANQPTADQKNNLVFYGLEPEPLEQQMEKEPEFCRDILETRIKMIFREYLKISRDIPFLTVYRFTTANADPDEVKIPREITAVLLHFFVNSIENEQKQQEASLGIGTSFM